MPAISNVPLINVVAVASAGLTPTFAAAFILPLTVNEAKSVISALTVTVAPSATVKLALLIAALIILFSPVAAVTLRAFGNVPFNVAPFITNEPPLPTAFIANVGSPVTLSSPMRVPIVCSPSAT